MIDLVLRVVIVTLYLVLKEPRLGPVAQLVRAHA